MTDSALLKHSAAHLWIEIPQSKPELAIVTCPEEFARLLEERLGRDAADYFRDRMIEAEDSACSGDETCECDRLYRIQESYQRAISDALDDLDEARLRKMGEPWTSGKVDVAAFRAAVKRLQEML